MRIFPILPIWLMIIICFLLLFFITKNVRKKKTITKSLISEIIMVILLFLINLRIMIPSDKAMIAANNLDIIFVIDNSISMVTNDYLDKTRLEGAKDTCNYIIDKLNGARFSLITFDDKAKVFIPFTKDSSMANEAISIIQTKAEYNAAGSSLNAPKEELLKSLKTSKDSGDRLRIVFFISDGEITREDQPLESFSELKEYIDGGAVLGFGTYYGGNMYVGNQGTWGDYVMANYGQDKAVSKLDDTNLKKIANDLDLDYIHVDREKSIYSKVKELQSLASSSFQSSDKSTYEDIYYIFVVPLLLLLLFNFKNYKGVYK